MSKGIRAWRKHRVLRWVNSIRKQYGLDPLHGLVKGDPGSASGCTITRSLRRDSAKQFNGVMTGSCRIDVYHVNPCATGQKFATIDMPTHVVEFRRAFDYDRYPELVLPA